MKKMTKLQLAEGIVRISNENGLKTLSVEKLMKDTKAFLEYRYEYLLNKFNSVEEKHEVEEFTFVVVNKRNEVQAMFIRRWQAEQFANEYGFEVKEISR